MENVKTNNGNGHNPQFFGVQPNLLDPKSGAMVFDELSGRLVSVPLGAFAQAVATLIMRGRDGATILETPTAATVLDESDGGPAEVEPSAARAPRRMTARNVKQQVRAGAKLRHARFGKVLAEAKYVGDGTVVYNRKTYGSISAAANAAAEDLGQKSRSLNGWVFWGVKKRARKAA